MSNVNELVELYVAGWNERDPSKRRALVARTYTDDGTYIDAHRSGDGHDGISAMIATVQDRFVGYNFRRKGEPEAHNGRVRFQWEAGGTKDAPLHFVGTDIGEIASDGRFKSILGFTDEAPAPAEIERQLSA